MEIINEVLNIQILQNSVYQIVLATIIFFVLYFGLKRIFKYIWEKTENTKTTNKPMLYKSINIIFKKIPKYFLWSIAIYIPLKTLFLSENLEKTINILFTILVILQVIKLSNTIFNMFLQNLSKSNLDKTSKNALQLVAKIIIRAVWILLLLDNIWVEITPLLASLGIWWIAIAFALQNILSDLFASFSILTSKPFKVWDFIGIGDKAGTVKKITLKSTQLKAISWEDIVMPNGEVLKNNINNYSYMKQRTKRFIVGVTYETWIKKLEKIPELVKNQLEKISEVEFGRCYMTELNSYSIDFKISYNMVDKTYEESLSLHQQVLINIIKIFEKENIEIAYPTQVIHTKK